MISLGGGGGGNSTLAYGLLLFAVVTMTMLSFAMPFFAPATPMDESNLTLEDLENQYYEFTGSVPTSEAVWGLSGIYTPYGVDTDGNASSVWGRTDDGWLYGQRVVNYTPTQYADSTAYSCSYNDDQRLYYYSSASTTVNQHKQGDLYGAVVMDVDKKSDMFFTSSGKVTDGSSFYYSFDGYRYSFQPISAYTTVDADGNNRDIVPNTTSLSLIWYDYYGDSGIAGQLIITGSDSGVAYLTSAQIVSAFNSDTSTSKFNMTFNGVDMYISIRLDPVKLQDLTVEQCYDLGYWSIMVSSKSVDVGSMVNADYSFDPVGVFQTMIDLLTFKTSDYGLTGIGAFLSSFIIVLPLMIGLLVIGMDHYPVLILAGIWGILAAWNWSGFGL